jgi:hypothetical protein
MEARLGVIRAGPRSALDVGGHGRRALDAALAHPAELWVAVVREPAVAIGAFGRNAGAARSETVTVRRGSGGPPVLLGPGTVHVALTLAHPAALVACDERRIVNRHVRPLLRALTKVLSSPARFFGSDWIDVGHRPVAWVGFGHDAASRRTLFEAFVAVQSPFALAGRPAFRGKAPATLEEIAGRAVDPERVAEAVVGAYEAESGGPAAEIPSADVASAVSAGADDAAGVVGVAGEPPWEATVEEAIGVVGAGRDARGVLRVGGDLLVSRDALARLEQRVAAGDDLDRAVDESLAAPGVALDGVRTLASVRDVIARARAPRSSRP